MSEPDAEFRAAVEIIHSEHMRAASRWNIFRLMLEGEKATVTREGMAGAAEAFAAAPTSVPIANLYVSLMYLRSRYQEQAGGHLAAGQVRALVLGVHAGMAAQELWECVHGAPWPPEDTLLTLGALRDPRVAAALATAGAGTNRPSTNQPGAGSARV